MIRNSKQIQAATRNYYGAIGDEQIIAPISKQDIDIIGELVELLKKTELYEAADIMKHYKLDPDESILEELMGLNVETGGEVEEAEGGEKKLPFWVHFEDINENAIIRPNIVHFKRIDSVGRDQDQYGIMLNETPEDVKQVPMHANTVLLYDDEDKREKDIKQLKKLAKY